MNKTASIALKIAFLTALLTAVVGCGTPQINSAPPGLSLESVTVVDRQLQINLMIENRNDDSIFLEAVDLQMVLGDTPLFEHASPRTLEIDPRGREALELVLNANYDGLEILNAIETSQVYRLEGKLEFSDIRDYPVRLRGFLHPVPGQPGRYR